MRRKEQHIVKWAAIGFGTTALVDIILQWIEARRDDKPFTWENYNCKRTLKRAFVGSGAGAVVGYLLYEAKITDEAKLPFNSDEYLRKILSEEQLKSDPELFNKFLKYRNEIKDWLAQKFTLFLVSSPEDAGSFYKRTAISSNYDMDIILPFKRDAFTTLKEMYYEVFYETKNEFGSIATVSKQSKAIGVTFDYNGLPVHFDIVPGREINNFKKSKDLNLYVRPDWIWQRGTSFKTNVSLQKSITTKLAAAKRTIKLLKVYRERNGFSIPSVLIEQCVCEALSDNKYGASFSDTDNLLNSMIHIARKLEHNSVIDTANTNNNLLRKMTDTEKYSASMQLEKDVLRIENNPRYVKEVFQ